MGTWQPQNILPTEESNFKLPLTTFKNILYDNKSLFNYLILYKYYHKNASVQNKGSRK